MADPQIITTLTAKRNELEARIAAYEAEIEKLRQSIVAINGTLAIFSTTGEVRTGVSLNRLFKRGELFAVCKAAIAEAGKPLDTRELARACAVAKGLDPADRVVTKALALMLVTILTKRAAAGQIGRLPKRRGVIVWQVQTLMGAQR